MVRWYLGYECRRKPEKLIEQISQIVRKEDLSSEVPLLRIQKEPKPKQGYYFFIAIESKAKGEIPESLERSNMLKLDIFKRPVHRRRLPFDYSQIKAMVGASHQVENYTNLIPYHQGEEETLNEDPFDTSPFRETRLDLNQNPKPDKRLVYWLSAKGRGNWDAFRKICHRLNIDNPRAILRKLRLLGYIETSSNGKKWSIAPTALVTIENSNDCEFFICGQHNKRLVTILSTLTSLKKNPQPAFHLPPCYRFYLENSSDLEALVDIVSQEINIHVYKAGKVAQKMATKLPNLDDWEDRLETVSALVPEQYEWQFFDGTDFVECGIPRETGLYRISGNQVLSQFYMTLFYNTDTKCWKRGDWYGLRFLSLAKKGESLIARYDPKTSNLAIPFRQRWPELYERALVLSSGLLPSYRKTSSSVWLIYENISWDLAAELCQKLTVNLE